MTLSEEGIQLRKFQFCPVCGNRLLMQIATTPKDQRPMQVAVIKICQIHGFGRIASNTEGRAVLVFDTFDV